jgi:hypothetical protein
MIDGNLFKNLLKIKKAIHKRTNNKDKEIVYL